MSTNIADVVLTETPYLGGPIRVKRRDNSNNRRDWAGIYLPTTCDPKKSEISWDWLKNGECQLEIPPRVVLNQILPQIIARSKFPDKVPRGLTAGATVTLKVYEDSFLYRLGKGREVYQNKIEIRNPLNHVSVSLDNNQRRIEIFYQFGCGGAVPQNGFFTLLTGDGIRISTHRLPSNFIEGTVSFQMPRVGGTYEVRCLYDNEGTALLYRSELLIVPNPANIQFCLMKPICNGGSEGCQVLVVCPGQYFSISLSGETVNSTNKDIVLVIPFPLSSLNEIDSQPSQKRINIMMRSGEDNDRCYVTDLPRKRFSISEIGIYLVCLILDHDGCNLLGTTSLLIVTSRIGNGDAILGSALGIPVGRLPLENLTSSAVATCTAGDAEPSEKSPVALIPKEFTPPTAFVKKPMETNVGDFFTCCICYDKSVTMLLQPCNHVCLCEDCANLLTSTASCPLCREEIKSKSKVFFS
eukprot:Tbor_TRINITY_DN5477_c0_g6::TRINITY_DN5477_c0_g6_i1::g.25434::m.25434